MRKITPRLARLTNNHNAAHGGLARGYVPVMMQHLSCVLICTYYKCTHFCCLSALASSVDIYLASQSSHLNNAFFYYLPAILFLFYYFLKEPHFPFFVLFLWAFFLYRVRPCYRRASTVSVIFVLQYRKNKTAQRNQPAQSHKESTRR